MRTRYDRFGDRLSTRLYREVATSIHSRITHRLLQDPQAMVIVPLQANLKEDLR